MGNWTSGEHKFKFFEDYSTPSERWYTWRYQTTADAFCAVRSWNEHSYDYVSGSVPAGTSEQYFSPYGLKRSISAYATGCAYIRATEA